jgi:tartrate-resistant acid phosphatase type 5
VIGDWGSQVTAPYNETQIQVAQAAAAYTTAHPHDFVLDTGDNFYPWGVQSPTDPRFKSDFTDVYVGSPAMVSAPWLVSLGNHDYEGIVSAQLQYSGDARWNLPDRNYTSRYCVSSSSPCEKYVTIVALDTSPWISAYYKKPETPEQKFQLASQHWKYQRVWLEGVLASVPATDEILVFGHHFIYSKSGPEADLEVSICGRTRGFSFFSSLRSAPVSPQRTQGVFGTPF